MIFTHPTNVCMTYLEHMKFSLNLSLILFAASIQAFVHAIIPDVCVNTTTNVVKTIENKLKNSGCKDK